MTLSRKKICLYWRLRKDDLGIKVTWCWCNKIAHLQTRVNENCHVHTPYSKRYSYTEWKRTRKRWRKLPLTLCKDWIRKIQTHQFLLISVFAVGDPGGAIFLVGLKEQAGPICSALWIHHWVTLSHLFRLICLVLISLFGRLLWSTNSDRVPKWSAKI